LKFKTESEVPFHPLFPAAQKALDLLAVKST